MALDMMAPEDTRRPRVVARLGRALALIPEPDRALPTIDDAVDRLELDEGADAATDYASEVMELLYDAGLLDQAFAVARLGLGRAGPVHDARWARFAALDAMGRDVSDPREPYIYLDTPERWEIGRMFGERSIPATELRLGTDPVCGSQRRPGAAHQYVPHW